MAFPKSAGQAIWPALSFAGRFSAAAFEWAAKYSVRLNPGSLNHDKPNVRYPAGEPAYVFHAFGIGDLANPLEAHLGYDQDDRVIALIVHGTGHEQSAD